MNNNKKVLIVVDMQNDFIDGALGTKEAVAIVPKVKEKIDRYIKQGYAVIFTRDTHSDNTYLSSAEGKKLPVKHCIKGTDGWQIGLESTPGTYRIIDKKTFGYFYWKTTLDIYEEYENIELCGLDTDICVITNALIIKTAYPDVEVTVDASCCAGSTPEKHIAALEVMKSCQINVIGEDENK